MVKGARAGAPAQSDNQARCLPPLFTRTDLRGKVLALRLASVREPPGTGLYYRTVDSMPPIERVAIIGLDCADPGLVFDRWLDQLPNLRRLTQAGLFGPLESCLPPITVPAWSCMACSKDPGTLGVYGFRNRRDWSYENLGIATNLEVRHPRMWDYIGRAGMSSILLGIPQTFPILRPPRGCMVTGFLTPGVDSPYTHPPELAGEIAELVGQYTFDVSDLRTQDKPWLLDRIRQMTAQRFQVARHLASSRSWSLFWMVDMGIDRLHHGFWHFMDAQHRRHVPGDPLENAVRDYYIMVDQQIGELLKVLDEQRTAIWVVSDHGAKRLDGGFCLNDWLIQQGLLVVKTPVLERRRFELADVDWARTKVWGEGGYCGACYINRAGREPNGIVPESEYETLRDELIAKLEALTDPAGLPMGNRAYRPGSLYTELRGCPPDLLVLFGDLHWRSVGTIGNSSLHVFESETGADAANHAREGLYILSHDSLPRGRQPASLYDVLPTTLDLFDAPIPRGLRGSSLMVR